MIQGLTGQLDMWRNREAFRASYPENVDALFASGEAPPALVAFVDCWTSLGGSQFLNSPGNGPLPRLPVRRGRRVRRRGGTGRSPDREHRGIQGKSSGGYGALVTPMLRPDAVLGARLATPATPCSRPATCPSSAKTRRALREQYDGSYDRFWEDFRSRPAGSKEHD